MYRRVIVALIVGLTLLGFACSSFSDGMTEGQDAGPGEDATAEASTPGMDSASLPDASPPLGCPGTTVVWDLQTTTPPSPFTADTRLVPSFAPMVEDGGPFGRFLQPLNDAGGAGQRYDVAFLEGENAFCFSARVRVTAIRPPDAYAEEMSAVVYTENGSLGAVSVAIASGTVLMSQANFADGTDAGRSVPGTTRQFGGLATEWHTVRIEAQRLDGGVRFATFFDGALELAATPYPAGEIPTGGFVGFGPLSMFFSDGGIVGIDYADIRVDLE